MMTQFFQVLKLSSFAETMQGCFMMTQFFQVLKQLNIDALEGNGFMMTQFFQVLKQRDCKYRAALKFYDDSILPGTKTLLC